MALTPTVASNALNILFDAASKTPAYYAAARRYRDYSRMYSNVSPYIRAAGKVYRSAKPALKKLGKAYNKYSKQRPSRGFEKVGHVPGSGTSEIHQSHIDLVTSSVSSRSLIQTQVISIPKNAFTTSGTNNRSGDMCYVSGFKLCCSVFNKDPSPIFVNMALITPKKSENNTIDPTDFFRSTAENERYRPFNHTLNANEMNCLPINSDAYIVHWRKKFQLSPENNGVSGAFNDPTRASYKHWQEWIPIKRQFRFYNNSETTSQPTDPHPVIVFWCDKVWANSNQTPSSGVAEIQMNTILYFRESRC